MNDNWIDGSTTLDWDAWGERLETLVCGWHYVRLSAISIAERPDVHWEVEHWTLADWTNAEDFQIDSATDKCRHQLFGALNGALQCYNDTVTELAVKQDLPNTQV